jgi:hypothetical protein
VVASVGSVILRIPINLSICLDIRSDGFGIADRS